MNPSQSGLLLLAGMDVVLTRPAGSVMCSRLRALGARCCNLPVIAVHPLPASAHMHTALDEAETSDAIVFASPNAVRFCYQLRPAFTPRGQVFAQGPATQTALRRYGVSALIPASGYTSEDVLAHPWFENIRGKTIVRISGAGGRDLLTTALVKRHAYATTLALYERRPMPLTQRHLKALANFKDPILIVSSVETLQTLSTSLPAALWQWLQCRRLLASSLRLSAAAKQAGFNQIILAASAAWADLRASLIAMAVTPEQAARMSLPK